MGRTFDANSPDQHAFDRAWLRAHAITDCHIKMSWGWRVQKAFPTGLMVLGIIAVTATMVYSILR